MNPKTIIFIGPQGSGKGTQVEQLLTWWKNVYSTPITLIETGRPFRQIASEGGFLADLIKERIEQGQLVPNVVTNALFTREVLHNVSADTTLVLDGYPRDVEQVNVLDNLLTFLKRAHVVVFYLDTPEPIVIERMIGRGRSDDTPEAIAKRLALYNELTAPVLSYYKERSDTEIVTIDGSMPIVKVTDVITNKLQELLTK